MVSKNTNIRRHKRLYPHTHLLYSQRYYEEHQAFTLVGVMQHELRKIEYRRWISIGKTDHHRIVVTANLFFDDDIILYFKNMAGEKKVKDQTLLNSASREFINEHAI